MRRRFGTSGCSGRLDPIVALVKESSMRRTHDRTRTYCTVVACAAFLSVCPAESRPASNSAELVQSDTLVKPVVRPEPHWTAPVQSVRSLADAPSPENYVAPGIEGLYAQLAGGKSPKPGAKPLPPRVKLAPYTRYEPRETPPDLGAFNLRQIVVKFTEGSAVRLRGKQLQRVDEAEAVETAPRLGRAGLEPADVARELRDFNKAIGAMRASVGRAAPQVDEHNLVLLRRRAEVNLKREMPDLNLFYFAHLPQVDGETAAKFLTALRSLRIVELAYFQPIPFDAADIPPLTTIDVTPSQGYFRAAPAGIDVDFARNFSAGRGNTVRIADIESGWHLNHEDLPRAAFGFGVNWGDSHGTAVLSELVAEENGIGGNGIAPNAMFGWSSVTNLDPFQGIYFYSVGNALLMAANGLRIGDIELIEQQFQNPGGFICSPASDPCGDCTLPPWVAVEEYGYEHAAITNLTGAGLVIVEAAGNGRMVVTPASSVDSGAIVVGAGNTALAPMCWSNFGPRVDVQGWGMAIGASGYGGDTVTADPTLRANGGDPDQWYTTSFGGTSGASPIVVGAAAIVQSTRLAVGQPLLSSPGMRSLLAGTGTPQAPAPPASFRNIGPQPDLRRAIASYVPDSARFVSQTNVASVLAPGTTFTRTAVFANSGGFAWPGDHTMSVAPAGQIGQASFLSATATLGSTTAPINPGAQASRAFSISAPLQPGTYNLTIVLKNALNQVIASSPTQQIVIAANNTTFDNATVTILTAPGSIPAGGTAGVTVAVTNTGTSTWTTAAYSLRLQRGLRMSLPQNFASLTAAVPPGATQNLSFIVGCNGQGQGFFSAQMGGTAGLFGQQASRTIVCQGP
jgi:hypothetical protein